MTGRFAQGCTVQQRTNLDQERGAESDAFTHFVWRGHRRESSLYEMSPEMVTTNGRTVRRMVADARGLIIQQFEDRRTGEAIVESVRSNCVEAGGLVGYSMLSDCEVLTIMSASEGSEMRWLASPGEPVDGRPRQMPTLPMHLSDVPAVRVTGDADLCWAGGDLKVDVCLHQQAESGSAERAPSPLEFMSTCQLMIIIDRGGKRRHVALSEKVGRDDFEREAGSSAFRGQLDIDEELYRCLGEDGTTTVWFVVSFERQFVSLPSPWRRWWFPVDVSDRGQHHRPADV